MENTRECQRLCVWEYTGEELSLIEYRPANKLVLGETRGRGRMERKNESPGAQVKTVLVYALVKDAARRLRGGG